MAQARGGKGKQPWHSVVIVTRANACTGALAARNQRFLSKDAPQLPLKDCPQASTCKCVYKHFLDRRDEPRRGNEATGMRTARPKAERRVARGRRKPDRES